MSQSELLKHLVEALSQAQIDYMLTGSIASSLQGEPRATHDIDIVVALSAAQVSSLLVAFPPSDYYVSETAIAEAINQRRMFNLLDLREGGKVDFWMLTDDAFDQSRFVRRRLNTLEGLEVYVSSPEDTILAKLKWAEESGGSEKQVTDALRIYEVQHRKLDLAYLTAWVNRLHLQPLWQRLQSQAMPLEDE